MNTMRTLASTLTVMVVLAGVVDGTIAGAELWADHLTGTLLFDPAQGSDCAPDLPSPDAR